jgi:hypothetical protein
VSDFLALDEIRSEPVVELPDREMLDLVRVTLITGDINIVRVDHNNLYNFLNGFCVSAVVAKCEVVNGGW